MTPAKVPEAASWGAYVHFPWCLKKCPYCDFLSLPVEPERLLRLRVRPTDTAGSDDAGALLPASSRESHPAPVDAATARSLLPHEAYANAVLAELASRRAALRLDSRFRSLFFGGGTPSLWAPAELGRVIRALAEGPDGPGAPQQDSSRHGSPASTPATESAPEITVECNPTSLDEDHVRALLDVGVNRISLGVQSLDEGRLRFLGRLHDADGARRALAAAQAAGAPRVSADLIFGVAGQSPAEAAAEARELAETGITHMSAYALTIEPNTRFGTLAQRGKLPLLDDALVADSFLAVSETLRALGFEHYEVSNYARKGHYALHNLGYWRGDDYLGLGVGAWGTVRLPDGRRVRYRNTASIESYLELWTRRPPRDPFAPGAHLSQLEPIDPETALREKILLGLRLVDGVNLDAEAAALGVSAWPRARARSRDRLLAQGRLELTGTGALRIPPAHWLFADGIIADLL